MFELLAQNNGVFVFISALLGLVVGSFLNVVIHRVPKMLEREWREQCAWLQGHEPEPAERYNLVLPPSACPECGHAIRWYENIPVVSWLALRGRCSQCQAAISLRYPLVELLTGLLFAAVAWKWGWSTEAGWAWALLSILVALTFIDFDTHLLPDGLTFPLAWAGLLGNLSGRFAPLDDPCGEVLIQPSGCAIRFM